MKNFFRPLLLVLLSFAATAQTTLIDPASLLKPGGNSTFLITNASGAVTYANLATLAVGGTGISISGNTITNSAPDQTVALTGAGLTVVTGTYPNFTITTNYEIQEEGSSITDRAVLNFVGAGITVADNASKSEVTLDADLNGLAGLSTTGLVVRTGSGTYTTRSHAVGSDASGLTGAWTNGDGVSGDPTLAITTGALAWKRAVRAVSTTNITLSGAQTIDGVSVVAGDRVLVAGQSTASGNGLYIAASGAWSRAGDADASSEFEGQVVYVTEGTANGRANYALTTTGAITVGSTSLTYKRHGRANQATAGTYGSATQVPVFTLNDDGTISGVTNTTITTPSITVTIQRYEDVPGSNVTTTTVSGFTPLTTDTMVFVDGVMMDWGAGEDITVSGSVITFNRTILAGQKIVVKKFTAI